MRIRIVTSSPNRLNRPTQRWNTSARSPAPTAAIVTWGSGRRSINRRSKWLSLHTHRHPASRPSRSTRGILDMMDRGIATYVLLEKSYLTVGPRWTREGRTTGSKVLFAGPVVTLGYALTAG